MITCNIELPHEIARMFLFDPKDDGTLEMVRRHYRTLFGETGLRIVGWTNPDHPDSQVQVVFDSEEDRVLFLLRHAQQP
jgi:hypothetical protein